MDTTETNILISAISAIATIAASVIYFYTLNELKKQRKNTYIPHIFIDKTRFYVQGVVKDKNIMPLNWLEELPEKTMTIVNEKDYNPFSYFYIKCYNIGFGSATNITIDFSYDIDEFIGILKKMEKKIPKELKINITKNQMFISFDCQNKDLPYKQNTIAIDNNLKHYISYILPTSINNDYSKIKLPIHFMELLNIYVFYYSNLLKKNINDLYIPPITTQITYRDISNQKFSKKLTITTDLNTLSVAGYSGEFIINLQP